MPVSTKKYERRDAFLALMREVVPEKYQRRVSDLMDSILFKFEAKDFTTTEQVITTIRTTSIAPTGTGFRHVTSGSEDAAAKLIEETDLAFFDVTTADADDTQHGLLPKLSGDSDDFFKGDGTWAASPRAVDPYAYAWMLG